MTSPAKAANMTSKLRVLHLTAGSDAGGLSQYVHDLSVAMIERGHQVAVAGERGAWHWLFERSPMPWVDVPLKGNIWDLARAVGMLRKWIDKNGGVDVLHCHYRRPTIVARGLQYMGMKVPVLYTLHLSHLGLSWGRRWISDFGDHVHVASTEALEWTRNEARVPLERISLIPHGVLVSKWPVTTPAQRAEARRGLGLDEGDRVAAYVGRLDYPKNCDWLVDVAAAWKNSDPELKILLAGEGPDFKHLQSRIDREGLSDRVRLLGHRDPLPIYQAADLLLLASEREGFSLVCAEAMCTGLPVLRTRTSGTAELIVEGNTGVSVPIDHRAFVQTAIDLLRDPEKLTRMRPPAAEWIRQGFTYEKQLKATIHLYQRLIQPSAIAPER